MAQAVDEKQAVQLAADPRVQKLDQAKLPWLLKGLELHPQALDKALLIAESPALLEFMPATSITAKACMYCLRNTAATPKPQVNYKRKVYAPKPSTKTAAKLKTNWCVTSAKNWCNPIYLMCSATCAPRVLTIASRLRRNSSKSCRTI